MLYRRWPNWWDDPLAFTPHALERMLERSVTEVEVRTALDDCEMLAPQHPRSTWIAKCRLEGRPRTFIVTPDTERHRLLVVTMYPSAP